MIEWIKIEDGVPNVGQEVIFFDSVERVKFLHVVTDYQRACLSLEEYDPRWDCVTHWIPAPKDPA